MKPATAKRLGGWQRLWIAIVVLGLAPAIGVVVAEWESGDAWLRDLETAAPTRVHVEGVGDVDFPALMSDEAIALVTAAGKGNADAVRAGTRAWDAALRKVLDAYAAEQNRVLIVRVLAVWAAGAALLYLAGALAGWVWRGFRT